MSERKNGAIYPELASSKRFLGVDASMPGSVMSNAIASHRSIPPVTPKNKRCKCGNTGNHAADISPAIKA